MSALRVEEFVKAVEVRVRELIGSSKAGRLDAQGRAVNHFAPAELKSLCVASAAEAIAASGMSHSELAALLPQALEYKTFFLKSDRTLQEIALQAFEAVLAEKAYEATIGLVMEQADDISLADIVNALQRGYSRVPPGTGRALIGGWVTWAAGAVIEEPNIKNLSSLIHASKDLDALLTTMFVNGSWFTAGPDKAFEKISREVFEMHSFGQALMRDKDRFGVLFEQFKEDVANDLVDVYIGEGRTKIRLG